MRYRTSATPADALGLGDMISPEYAASLMSDAASSATAFVDVLHLVWQVDLAEQCRASLDRSSVRDVGTQARGLLTLRRSYSSWAHEKGVPGKVIAQLMGHAKARRHSTCTRR
jgi:hypothetical protein